VAAAGNYGSASGPSGVPFAPGSDPFVITVGAADTGNWLSTADDFMAPWSAYGYTLDGFAKPELAAPGRYMVGPVPTSATLYSERADHVVDTGYMELSGTSFAAPVVSGIASLMLGKYPNLTPDQVKGALMRGARRLPLAAPLSAGAGEVNAGRALAYAMNPPAANRALLKFLVSDPVTGAPLFDAASWASTAKATASWASASWDSASWDSASWDSASWAEASWADASWASASWDSSSSAAASWADLSLGTASWADNAGGEAADLGGGAIDPAELTGVLNGTLKP
jgi:serine protease AprX